MDRDQIIGSVRRFIQEELLKRDDLHIDAHDSLFRSGVLDSFALANIAVFIELTWGVEIADSKLTVEHMDTLDRIAMTILRAAGLSRE